MSDLCVRRPVDLVQTWWRGERDRELVRQMLVQVERNWRWLNAGEDRDNFYYALPRAKYVITHAARLRQS